MKTKSITAFLLALLLWAGCEQPAQDSNDQPTYRKAQLVEGLVVTTKSDTPNEPPQKLFIVMKSSVVKVDSATGEPTDELVYGSVEPVMQSDQQCQEVDDTGRNCKWFEPTQTCECDCAPNFPCERYLVDGVGTILVDPIITDDLKALAANESFLKQVKLELDADLAFPEPGPLPDLTVR